MDDDRWLYLYMAFQAVCILKPGCDPDNTLHADGIYGEETKKAILRYQEVHGLRITGMLDDPTIACMIENPYIYPGTANGWGRKQIQAFIIMVLGRDNLPPNYIANGVDWPDRDEELSLLTLALNRIDG